MSDPDELEGAALASREVSGRAVVGTHLHSHDHLSRPVQTSEQTFTDGNTNTFQGDAINVLVDSLSELDAGIIVPERVWDTTGRVSADVRVRCTHDVSIMAAMTAPQCPGGTCCGHGPCHCKPAVALEFRNGAGKIYVDGQTFDIFRPAPTGPRAAVAGMAEPWVLA